MSATDHLSDIIILMHVCDDKKKNKLLNKSRIIKENGIALHIQ
uniref:Uncharacterized protein n=1 Tax=Rhizophora mucronata TaxID=61149 RepID=A0A2P2KK86_RHIMU